MTTPLPRARPLVLVAVAAVLSGLLVPLVVAPSAQASLRSRVSTAWKDTSVAVGRAVTVRGTVRPARRERGVLLQRRAHGRWVTVARRRTRDGRYTLRDAARRPGRYAYRVRVTRNHRARPAASARRSVRVRGRGNPRAFSFIARADGAVARWNPCRPIGYRVNARGGGPGALRDARRAVRRVERANGLRFAYRGRTRIIPGGRGSDRYPKGTQLVIAWARPGQTRLLDGGGVAGVGGPTWTYWQEGNRTQAMIIRGYAVLNADLDLGGGFSGGVHNGYYGTRGQLLMHEIGHAVGLDHPRQDDRWQIMYPTMTGKRAAWGAGDLRGLRRLGASRGCLRPPSPTARSGATTFTAHMH